jgi:hypothetical protein
VGIRLSPTQVFRTGPSTTPGRAPPTSTLEQLNLISVPESQTVQDAHIVVPISTEHDFNLKSVPGTAVIQIELKPVRLVSGGGKPDVTLKQAVALADKPVPLKIPAPMSALTVVCPQNRVPFTRQMSFLSLQSSSAVIDPPTNWPSHSQVVTLSSPRACWPATQAAFAMASNKGSSRALRSVRPKALHVGTTKARRKVDRRRFMMGYEYKSE